MALGRNEILLVIALSTASALYAWVAIPRIVFLSAVPTTFGKGHNSPRNEQEESCINRHSSSDRGSRGNLPSRRVFNNVTKQQQQQQQQQQVAADYHAGVPADFDWQVYLDWHPEMRENGVKTETAAKQHYLQFGRAEGRMYKRHCMVILYYSLSLQGLVNQWYVHLAALMLAKALGSELVLPPAMHRGAFAGETKWFMDPTETLLDVEAIAEYWSGRGVHIHAEEELVHLLENEKVSALRLRGNVSLDVGSRVYVEFGKYATSNRTFNETVALARKAIVVQTEARMRLHPKEEIPNIVVHFGSVFWPFRSPSDYDLVLAGEAARSLRFPPLLVGLADEVLRHVTDHGKRPFNGLHLRIEDDMVHMTTRLGGKQEVWKKYATGMQESGFSNDNHVYVASGLEENDYLKDILTDGLAVEVHHKAMYLSKITLSGLNTEQRAAVDFLVLAQSHSFVGFGPSTFSFLLPQYKTLMGYPPAPSVLISGVSGMFETYGRVAAVSKSSVI